MRFKNLFIFVCVFFLISFLIYPEEEKKTKDKDNFSSFLFVSYSVSKGNSKGQTLSGECNINYKQKNFDILSSYEQYYGKSDGIVNINKGRIFLKVEKKIKKSANINTTATYEYDKLADLIYRMNYGLGLSLNGDKKLSFTGNLIYEFEHFSNREKTDKETFRLMLRVNSDLKLNENSHLKTTIFYTPGFKDLINDYRIELKTSLKLQLKPPFWLKLSILDQYNNNPYSETIKKNDFTMLTGIEVNI